MIFEGKAKNLTPLRQAIVSLYRMDETECVEHLLQQASLPKQTATKIADLATQLIKGIREREAEITGLDNFMKLYDLSSQEGIALMCLAESLLRIPDKETMELLIRDKLSNGNWRNHLHANDSFFTNAATWGLLLTGKIVADKETREKTLTSSLKSWFARSSEPLIRQAIKQAMRLLSHRFIKGRNIEDALQRSKNKLSANYSFSYDMLGEAARTADDAQAYFKSYQQAIIKVSEAATESSVYKNPGVSVKLSALHPRYEFSQQQHIFDELCEKALLLAQQAQQGNINLTIDAEEANRLDFSLDIFEYLFTHSSLNGWEGLGLAVQAYQKRATAVVEWLADLAIKQKKRIMVRLIKGAYWDTEVKDSQVQGYNSFPVFTRKEATDLNYFVCAQKLLANTDSFYPMFGTHNAYTVATILTLASPQQDFEFQCLHGMGKTLYEQIVSDSAFNKMCRIYAPVGGHEKLLAYLMRRLLENGANTSFVNHVSQEKIPINDLIRDPIVVMRELKIKPHPRISIPGNLYGTERRNSQGLDLTDYNQLRKLAAELTQADQIENFAMASGNNNAEKKIVINPSNKNKAVGYVINGDEAAAKQALSKAQAAFFAWNNTPVEQRCLCLTKTADLFEQNYSHFINLAIKEAGKTLPDAVAEIREAIDFCRYYSSQAQQKIGSVSVMRGPTGEVNQLSLHGRGIMVCISPWNFPLAIFTGQVVAALVTGNTVIAKPADQTPLIAAFAVKLMHQSGIPKDVMQLLPGKGSIIGNALVCDPRTAGVLFTGSTETARLINKNLAIKSGPIVPLIAETGGQNAMIVDSSALLEQVTADIIQSAFGSAGQRCSALRVLFVQNDIADALLTMLKGAMEELRIGDPGLLSTDIGPVIDADAKQVLEQHILRMTKEAKFICKTPMSESSTNGYFVAPHLFELSAITQLQGEVFGPILHVIRYKAKDLDMVINAINSTDYGLTCGIHSRINSRIEYVRQRINAGNFYANRNMIGAVVGVQPFGGEGLSGTGPKAGGPNYLLRLCVERTLCVNTTAAGGNASLLNL